MKNRTDNAVGRSGAKPGDVVGALRAIAMRYPAVEESVSCKGTALESSRFSVAAKAFLFASNTRVMVRLVESLGEARALGEGGAVRVGANGWATLLLRDGERLPLALLRRWIDESHRAVAGATSKPRSKRSAARRARP